MFKPKFQTETFLMNPPGRKPGGIRLSCQIVLTRRDSDGHPLFQVHVIGFPWVKDGAQKSIIGSTKFEALKQLESPAALKAWTQSLITAIVLVLDAAPLQDQIGIFLRCGPCSHLSFLAERHAEASEMLSQGSAIGEVFAWHERKAVMTRPDATATHEAIPEETMHHLGGHEWEPIPVPA